MVKMATSRITVGLNEDGRVNSRVLKPPGGNSSIFSDTESTSGASSVDSRSSSASPKTPAKTYKMASNFELSDEQPPEANRLRRPFKPSVNPLTGELIGCPGVIVAEPLAVTPQRPKSGRVPPGGFSTPLW